MSKKSPETKSYYYKKSISIEKYNNRPAIGKCEVVEKIDGRMIKKVYDLKESSDGKLKYIKTGNSHTKLLK